MVTAENLEVLIEHFNKLNNSHLTKDTVQSVKEFRQAELICVEITSTLGREIKHLFYPQELEVILGGVALTPPFPKGIENKSHIIQNPWSSEPLANQQILKKPPTIVLDSMPKKPSDKNDKRYMLSCSCDKHLMCSHINRIFQTQLDGEYWWPTLLRSPHTWITLGIPVFGHVLHRISVKLVALVDWEDNEVKKIQVKSNCTDSTTRYYNPPPTGVSGINQVGLDQIEILCDTVRASVAGEAMLRETESLINGIGQMRCSNISKGRHSFGDTKRLIDWLKAGDDLALRIFANAFCEVNYDLCYICHLNDEPSYSLIILDK